MTLQLEIPTKTARPAQPGEIPIGPRPLVRQDRREVSVPRARTGRIESAAIRVFDVSFALTLFTLLLPFLTLVAIALKIDSPGRLFFIHRRVGKDGRMFGCIKFRTMVENADEVLKQQLASCSVSREEWERDFKLRNDPRVTRLGAILRKLSIDELPQLMNVLAGEMSMVGPRPIVRAEVERYGRFFPSYASVRPGITGLWQISGRNDVSYHERVMLDCRYVARKSLLGDIAIVLRTVPAVLFARGSY